MGKILVIEDDPLVSRMYKQAFELEGMDVDVALSGAEGVQKAKAILPSVIMLDIMMPEMDGMQVLDVLKSDEKTKNIPIIMLTNLAGTQDKEIARKKGAADYMVKSEFTPREVVEKIKALIKGS